MLQLLQPWMGQYGIHRTADELCGRQAPEFFGRRVEQLNPALGIDDQHGIDELVQCLAENGRKVRAGRHGGFAMNRTRKETVHGCNNG